MPDRFFWLLIGLAIVIAVPVAWIVIRAEQAEDNWCLEHGMQPTTGAHAPTYCYDPKTRLVYKPE